MKRLKGFTLVELLVVVAIIGILSTVVVINITGAQKKARATKAVSDMNEALKVANACVINEGTVVAYSAGTDICSGASSDMTVVNAKWPAVPSSAYLYKVTVANGAVTAAAIRDKDDTGNTVDGYTFTCTAQQCTK